MNYQYSNNKSFISGKYSDFKSIDDKIDDPNSPPVSNNYITNHNGSPGSSNGVNSSLSETSKRLDELTPLLNETSINSTTPPYSNQIPVSNSTSGGRQNDPQYFRKSSSHHHASSKSGHRKKTKTKSSRKAASYNANFSDSDKN